MPRISEFYGIVILMFWNDHNPPHFHAIYGEFEVLINITDFSVYAGEVPGRAYGLIMEWALMHKKELLHNWLLLSENKEPVKIDSLR